MFERKIPIRIYGPIEQDGVWRKGNNNELYAQYNGNTIVRFAKINRLRWAGHVQSMWMTNVRQKELSNTKRKIGRPKNRCCLLYTSRCV